MYQFNQPNKNMENLEYATEEELEIYYKLQKTLLGRREQEDEWAKRLREKVKEEKIEAKMKECFQKKKGHSIKLHEVALKIRDIKDQMDELKQEFVIVQEQDNNLTKEILHMCPNHEDDGYTIPLYCENCVCSKHWEQFRCFNASL
jgi:hypothetical protein